jgi:hypothetical protein
LKSATGQTIAWSKLSPALRRRGTELSRRSDREPHNGACAAGRPSPNKTSSPAEQISYRPAPRRTPKEEREWRMTFALARVAGGLFVLFAIERVMRFL